MGSGRRGLSTYRAVAERWGEVATMAGSYCLPTSDAHWVILAPSPEKAADPVLKLALSFIPVNTSMPVHI